MAKASNKKQGAIFENYVESLYKSLGFKTSRNTFIAGQEIDIIAERYIDGVGPIKIFIECKFMQKGNLSNQEVINFSNYIGSVITKDIGLTKGVVVTSNGFTPNAKMAATNHCILVVVSELEQEVLDLNNPYVILKREYETKEIFNDYIPLSGRYYTKQQQVDEDDFLFEKDAALASRKKKRNVDLYDKVSNLEDKIIDDLTYHKWREWGMISILGDYGSGKTTLMQRIFYRLILMYLNKEINERPVYLELKNYYKFKDLESFLIQDMRKLFSKEISPDLLKREIEKGSFIFLLDGFDEMSPQISKKIRLENFNILFPLLTSSTSLITCRPSYFVSNSEYAGYIENVNKNYKSKFDQDFSMKPSIQKERKKMEDTYNKLHEKYFSKPIDPAELKDTVSIYIDILSKDQIDLFLKKYDAQFRSKCKSDWEAVKDFLGSIYDLSELMTKPLLLKIIIDTIIISGEKYSDNKELQGGPAAIYELYTTLNLDFDWQKGETRVFLTRDQRRSFAQAIAIVMFDNGVLEVQYEELMQVVAENKIILMGWESNLPNVDIENIVADVQICSFITRSYDDKFKFVHKSFMEFFIARVIKSLILTPSLPNQRFENIAFPKEVLYFLGSFCGLEPTLKSKLFQALNVGRNQISKRNVAAAYIYSSPEHEKISIRKVVLNEINLSKTCFLNCGFSTVGFPKNEWKATKFNNCDFENVDIEDSSLFNVLIEQAQGKIRFIASNFEKCRMTGSQNLSLSLVECSAKDTHFENCTIQFLKVFLNTSTFKNVSLELKSFFGSQNLTFENVSLKVLQAFRLTDSKLKNVSFDFTKESLLQFANTTLENCTFNSNEIQIDSLKCLINCSGLAMVDLDKSDAKRIGIKFDKGRATVGNLYLVNLERFRHRKEWAKKIIQEKAVVAVPIKINKR